MTEEEKYARLAVHLLKGCGPACFLQALDRFGSARAFLEFLNLEKTKKDAYFRRSFLINRLWHSNINIAEVVAKAKNYSLKDFVVFGEAAYPELLKEITDPPPALFIKGNSSLLSEKNCISVVGTRKISAYGNYLTKMICRELVDSGFCIISGMAFGVDALVHETVLAQHGKTIAVLGTGILEPVPRTNWRLYENIKQKGLLISEFYQQPVISKGIFPRRNRIIAGLSKATIIIEAPEHSGALITAKLPNDYNREVYAVPGNFGLENSQGCNYLIKENIGQIFTGVNEIISDLHLQVAGESAKNEAVNNSGKTETGKVRLIIKPELRDLLISKPMSISEIQKNLLVDVKILRTLLVNLEISGEIFRDYTGRYQLLKE